MADSNTVALRYLAETTWGTTPGSAMQNLRYTGESLTETEESTESAEIITDRQLRDVIRTGRSTSGGVNFELSYGTLDDLLQGALCDTWASNVLENGTERHSFTFEKEIVVDGSPSSHFLTIPGFRIGQMDLQFTLGSVITGSLSGMGKAMVSNSATAGTGPATAANTNEPFSVTDITSIQHDSVELSGITSFNLSINNNLRTLRELGSQDVFGIGYGGFRVSGTIVQYFQDRNLLDDYIADTRSQLGATVTDSAGNAYEFLVPLARLGAPTIVAQGQNSDVEASIPFTGIMDAGSTERMLIISRTPA